MSQDKSKKITRRRVLATSLGAVAAVGAGAGSEARAQRRRKGSLEGKKVLVAIGDFSEGMETYYMVYRLKEEGVIPVVAANEARTVQMVVHDFDPNYTNYIEKSGYMITADVAYKDVDPADYDGLLIPGGRGPEEIRQYEEALEITGYFFDKKLPLGAMCHGPQVIWAARPIKGRKIACYYGIQADVEMAGAQFVDAAVVVDGAMVTSRGWPDLPDFMPVFLDVLAKGKGKGKGARG